MGDNQNNSENREYKSDVFSMLMQYPEYALDVYNALNGSKLTDPTLVETRTLEKGISLTVRNDAAFIVDATLNIYEHQSTYNVNMPLRALVYLAEILKPYIKDKSIYGSTLITIPKPNFVVIYNGIDKDVPPVETLRLSDAYRHGTDDINLELICTLYNINADNNKSLKQASYVLNGYMTFVDKVRENIANQVPEPIKKAIDYCKKHNILRNFFEERSGEVIKNMTIDMTFEKQLELTKRDYYQDGLSQGLEQGIANLVIACKELTGSSDDAVDQLMKKYGYNHDKAKETVLKYW